METQNVFIFLDHETEIEKIGAIQKCCHAELTQVEPPQSLASKWLFLTTQTQKCYMSFIDRVPYFHQ